MATSALLVVDVTVEGVAAPWASAILEPIAGELDYYRSRGRFIAFACEPATGDAGPRQALHPACAADPLDAVFHKRGYSAFHGTELEATLRERGVDELRIVGLQTHTGVLYTAADAASRGLAVVVSEPCVAAADDEDHRWALRQVREVLVPYPRP